MARAPKFGRSFSRRRGLRFRWRPRLGFAKVAPRSAAPRGLSDRLLGWVISLVLHLVGLFTFVLAVQLLIKPPAAPPPPLIMPQSFLSGNQLTDIAKTRHAPSHHSLLKDFLVARNIGAAASSSSLNAWLNGSASNAPLFAITLGPGGDMEGSGGPAGALGVPGNALGGLPAVSFFGVHGQARRIVFIIDHSGSMIGHLYLVRAEVRHAVENLLPFQKFAVIAFAHAYKLLGPQKLVRASPEAKASALAALHRIEAEGHNDNMLGPFLRPFQTAWAMRPQAIFFLTDGHFDPRLIARIAQLNTHYPIRVYTFAFLDDDRVFQGHLRRIATETGGQFKNLSARVLERAGAGQ